MANANNKIRYTEIAKTAGVSIATVSRVLNQRNLVKPQTLNRVLTAMQSLGYHADFSSAESSAKVILVILPSIGHVYYIDIVKGIKAATGPAGYTILINDDIFNGPNLEPLLYLVKRRMIAGLIICGNLPIPVYRQLRGLIPMVQCCDYSEESDLSFVACDDLKAMSRLMQYVLALGCKKIAFLNGDTRRFSYARLRFKSYTDSMNKAGLEINPNWVIPLSEVNNKNATSAAMSILQGEELPECFVCTSDIIAVAVIKACQDIGLRVPDDVMVTGFDNIDFATASSPSLTTVNQPRHEIGLTAGSYLLDQIANPAAPIMHTCLETELIIRESTIGF